MATGMMIDGKWQKQSYQNDRDGHFQRNITTFRDRITADGSSGFQAESNRYHLYVSYACPWAHRTLIVRKLKGLENVITLSVVHPLMGDEGWTFAEFSDTIPDSINHAKYLREVYAKADPNYTGRVTVPILWDKKNNTIVNNESREIIEMLDQEFAAIATQKISLYPEKLRDKINQTIDAIYNPINNGVYRAGFATTKEAYNESVIELFENLDYWDNVLAEQRFLCGNNFTAADICIFTTLLRFDLVYYVHFKCNLRHLWDYENLWNYLKEIYQHSGIKETCKLDHIKNHYYQSHPQINPSGIVPLGPIIDFDTPHNRNKIGSKESYTKYSNS